MKFSDYSPPILPSLAQQWDALRKGLGRALQWAMSGRLDDGPLLEACLQDQRFDAQVESSRGDWLWRIIQATGAIERLRVPLLHALYDLSDERSVDQLCKLARHYAARGDEAFRERLYEIVEENPWMGDEEIVQLDGEQGFLFAVQVRGRLLAVREWEWDDGYLVWFAGERFGEERVRGLLETSSDEAIRHFRDCWLREKQREAERVRPQSRQDRMKKISVEEIIAAVEGESKCYWLVGWGRHAEEAELQIVLQHLWAARESRVIAHLLRAFARRALPNFDDRLIELCRHKDDQVRRLAFLALGQNNHPLVRECALSELAKGVREAAVASLFINNYRQGDENRILEAMELPEDEDELHWLLMNVKNILQKHPEADCSRLGVICYALTPCANCRFFAGKLLFAQKVAPAWLREECRYDSDDDFRELLAKETGSM